MAFEQQFSHQVPHTGSGQTELGVLQSSSQLEVIFCDNENTTFTPA